MLLPPGRDGEFTQPKNSVCKPTDIHAFFKPTDLPNGRHGRPPSAVRPHPEDAGVRAVGADIAGRGAPAPLLRPRAALPQTGHLQMIQGCC